MALEAAGARVHLLVSGRVQGVWFRGSTAGEARKLALSGWVRNLADGRVEVLAEGPRPALEKLVTYCHRGPTFARVSAVAAEWSEPRGDLSPFEVAYS